MAADSDTKTGLSGCTSIGGVSARHEERAGLPVLVGLSVADELNTLKPPLLPIACWRLEDMRFDFDSSFVKWESKDEFTYLAETWDSWGKPPMSVFGHADPVGNDDYNKVLSGRRAMAIYGLLIRDTAIWEELYSQPFGNDHWGVKSIQVMLKEVGFDPGPQDGIEGPETQKAVKDFQSANAADELTVDGIPGPKTRAVLFLAYMNAICANKAGQPFILTKKNFLAQGDDDPGRKGDMQGCSEFNPLLVFSQKENKDLSQPGKKTERDTANAPNRRVLIFLFPTGSYIDFADWPCPRVKEGKAGCLARFWPDGDYRRSFQEKRREYAKDKNTFACLFYDSMARRSPCETVRQTLRIRLLDTEKHPIKDAPYRLSIGNYDVRTGRATNVGEQGGWLIEHNVLAPSRCTIEWGDPLKADPEAPDNLPYRLIFYLDVNKGEDEEAYKRRLHNLGYAPSSRSLEGSIMLFQRDYGLTITGTLNDETKGALKQAHDEGQGISSKKNTIT